MHSCIEYPPHWDSHKENEDFQIVPLDEQSVEFQCVAERFYSTMENAAKIKRIDRIQNRLLWHKYTDKSKEMAKFGDGVLNEELLFHGSGKNDPVNIYKGDASFDMRFSRDGMWGKGNYFAVNASYSDGYAFTKTTATMKCKMMLAALVLTGHSFYSKPQKFTHPPYLEEAHGAPLGRVRRRYDSVSGTTGGSKVYITYDNTLAYPAYLITYTGKAI